MVIHTIELCSGVGMLGEGLRAGLRYLGIETRTICHVEREAYAASVLAARIEEGSMDQAPVWSDLCTFDARAWHGKVDCIVAGFPCQDLSVAGKRAGLDGKRSGLFFEVCRIATDSGAWLMFLENVAGIASASATVMDAEEGELDERAASRVVGELADLGWDAEWIHVSACDVGASHGRERWFCLAWRVADAEGKRFREARGCYGKEIPGTCSASAELADAGITRLEGRELGSAHNGNRGGAGSTWIN
jgi:DNA (cytosine-5)-methyltransferase 1